MCGCFSIYDIGYEYSFELDNMCKGRYMYVLTNSFEHLKFRSGKREWIVISGVIAIGEVISKDVE